MLVLKIRSIQIECGQLRITTYLGGRSQTTLTSFWLFLTKFWNYESDISQIFWPTRISFTWHVCFQKSVKQNPEKSRGCWNNELYFAYVFNCSLVRGWGFLVVRWLHFITFLPTFFREGLSNSQDPTTNSETTNLTFHEFFDWLE